MWGSSETTSQRPFEVSLPSVAPPLQERLVHTFHPHVNNQAWSHPFPRQTLMFRGWGRMSPTGPIKDHVLSLSLSHTHTTTLLDILYMHAKSLQSCPLFVNLWTVDCQAPLSIAFSRQEYRGGLPCPSLGDFPNQGLNPCLLCLLHWQVCSLPLAPAGKPSIYCTVSAFAGVLCSWTLRPAKDMTSPLAS